MRPGTLLKIVCAVTAAACAQLPRESPVHAARMQTAADAYVSCVTAEAEKDMKNAAAVEEIALAAHARCGSAWDAYDNATRANFAYDTHSPEEKQFAHDKTRAHLREFERETRRVLVDTMIERRLKGDGTAK